jgi:hypothetical protein
MSGQQLKRKRPRKKPAVNMARQLSRRVARIENAIEIHYHDVAIDTNIDWNGLLTNLTLIPQGNTDVTRQGDSLTLTHLSVNFAVGRVLLGKACRVIIFKDKQNDVATVGDLLASTGLVNSVLEHYVWDNRHRFTVIYDHFIRLDGVFSQTELRTFRFQLNQRVQYAAGTTTVTTGALKMLLITDVNVGLGTPPFVDIWCRLQFKDL